MCLRYSFGRGDDAELLEKAVERVLAEGYRTADIMQPGMKGRYDGDDGCDIEGAGPGYADSRGDASALAAIDRFSGQLSAAH